MGFLNVSRSLFESLRLTIPYRARLMLKRLGLKDLLWRLDPRSSPEHVWTVKTGHLIGARLRIGSLENYHIVEKPYEPTVCAVMVSHVTRDMVCVDAGAHIGYFTILLARLVGPSGSVVAFEPDAQNAALICDNVMLNQLDDRVTVRNVALGDGAAPMVKFYRGATSSQGSITARPDRESVEVSSLSLDMYFKGNPRLDFVKIDVEGAEGLVVAGMLKVLELLRPLVLVEVHGVVGASALHLLQNAGYELHLLSGQPVGSALPDDRIFHTLATPRQRPC